MVPIETSTFVDKHGSKLDHNGSFASSTSNHHPKPSVADISNIVRHDFRISQEAKNEHDCRGLEPQESSHELSAGRESFIQMDAKDAQPDSSELLDNLVQKDPQYSIPLVLSCDIPTCYKKANIRVHFDDTPVPDLEIQVSGIVLPMYVE